MDPRFTVVIAQVQRSDGVAIAATGMAIVFAALLLITLFISALPRILEVVATVFPEVPDRHAPLDPSESLLPDEAVVAAIGYVLHTEVQRQARTGTAAADHRTGVRQSISPPASAAESKEPQ